MTCWRAVIGRPYRDEGGSLCPCCGAGLAPAVEQGCRVERCPACAGIFIAEAMFLALLQAAPDAQHLQELMLHNDGAERRACPRCLHPMDHAWIDFLRLQRCEAHGVWLDDGTLERALRSGLPIDLSHLGPRRDPDK